jgi:hypothetical protein
MPYEGSKGGGFDRSSLIRPPYYRRQVAIPSTSEQFAPLSAVHNSLQCDFRPVRRYESHMTTGCGRQFATIHTKSWQDHPMSLNYLNERGKALYSPKYEIGATSSQAVGGFWLIDNKLRPNTSPAFETPSLKPILVKCPYAAEGFNMPS